MVSKLSVNERKWREERDEKEGNKRETKENEDVSLKPHS
jgi:hypothetical protein